MSLLSLLLWVCFGCGSNVNVESNRFSIPFDSFHLFYFILFFDLFSFFFFIFGFFLFNNSQQLVQFISSCVYICFFCDQNETIKKISLIFSKKKKKIWSGSEILHSPFHLCFCLFVCPGLKLR